MNSDAVPGLKTLAEQPAGERIGGSIERFVEDDLVVANDGWFLRIADGGEVEHFAQSHSAEYVRRAPENATKKTMEAHFFGRLPE
jgi:hypothetical protein